MKINAWGPRCVLAGAIGAAILTGVLVPVLLASGTALNLSQYPNGSTYAALPATATANFGVSLAPLSTASLASVGETPTQATAVAGAHEFVTVPPSETPQVLLGLFTDSEYGPPSANGIIEPLLSNVPAYVITYSNATLLYYGPPGGSTTGRYSVVVNAVTGDYVMAFSGY
jgi:hypothetical protein